MKEYLYEIIRNSGDLGTEDILLHITVAALLGGAIFLSYWITHAGAIYSRKFNITLLTLTILTATVMTVIGNNIALSLGMVGALSIIRFRTSIKDSRDTIYIFWTIIVGICCGVGDLLVACIGSGVVFVVILLLGCIKNDNRMLLIIRAGRGATPMVKSLVYKLFDSKAILRVENTTESTVELIYELAQKMLRRAEKKEPNIADSIYRIGSIEYVNIVMQNDEISN